MGTKTKTAGMRKLLATYRAMKAKHDAVYARLNREAGLSGGKKTREIEDEEWDATYARYGVPLREIRSKIRSEAKRLHGVKAFDHPRAVLVDGTLVTILDTENDMRPDAVEIIDLADVLTIDADDQAGVVMRLTKDEATIVDAYRNRAGARDWRPPVISGFQEPTTIPELVEIVRLFLEYNVNSCIDEFPRQLNRLDIQGGYGDELPHTSILFVEGDYNRDLIDVVTPDEAELLAKHRARKDREWRRDVKRHEAEREAKAKAEMGPKFEPASN